MSDDAKASINFYQRLGLFFVFLLAVCAGGWAAWAHISGAVIAPATVVVESNSKKVQHLEGGIVDKILVKNGDYVEAGALLLTLDEVETRANLSIVESQLNELTARQARLEAERDGANKIIFPAELIAWREQAEIAKIIAGQETLFEARVEARAGQKEQLTERIGQLKDEIAGLEAQKIAKQKQIDLIGEELSALLILREKTLVPITRILAMQREEAKLKGEHGQIIGDIARAEGRIGETKLSIIQVDQEMRTEVLAELRDAQTKIAELKEREVAARAKLKRTKIHAPRAGFVHQLNVHTVGGVISASEPVMLIVPKSDVLVLDAQIEPQKIDQVAVGQKAVVRFSAFDQKTTPELNGEVVRVSADVVQERAEQPPFYKVRIKLSKKELKRMNGQELKPGMPAEAFIQTGERTVLSYLIKPLTDQINKTFRER